MKIYQYFLIGIKQAWDNNLFKIVLFTVGTVLLVSLIRKLVMVSKSGGKFSEPMHIANGNLYIHSGIVPGNRVIPLKELEAVEIHFVRGRRLNGHRYFIEFVRKKGRNKGIIIGKDKATEARLTQIKKQLKKHKVKVREIK
ncbi:hypothetical protein [Mogibacterium pumilum]|uniref:DUF5673 domain-containing protein n=1 Tax=Mogibacterium pumilum TaxID=86332 RepID=A0A223ARI9_9FIRM|nr:hypothetical protein [Mogibacterium pumilum]ASS37583.1 hypothetical protein AXF17_03340 [Mogibacterium pumilum]